MIRGKKNFLQPSKLELGFTVLFLMDDDTAKQHEGERKHNIDLDDYDESMKQLGGDEDEEEEAQEEEHEEEKDEE